jgi:hypothetical protein
MNLIYQNNSWNGKSRGVSTKRRANDSTCLSATSFPPSVLSPAPAGSFPQLTPTEGLKIDRLAQLDVAGGHIRNVAMGAAFLAADAGEPVRMGHLLSAARLEFADLEKPLIDAEIAG